MLQQNAPGQLSAICAVRCQHLAPVASPMSGRCTLPQHGVPVPLLAQTDAQRSIQGKNSGSGAPTTLGAPSAGLWARTTSSMRDARKAMAGLHLCRQPGMGSVCWGDFREVAVPKGNGALLYRNLPCSKLLGEMNSTEYSLFHQGIR